MKQQSSAAAPQASAMGPTSATQASAAQGTALKSPIVSPGKNPAGGSQGHAQRLPFHISMVCFYILTLKY